MNGGWTINFNKKKHEIWQPNRLRSSEYQKSLPSSRRNPVTNGWATISTDILKSHFRLHYVVYIRGDPVLLLSKASKITKLLRHEAEKWKFLRTPGCRKKHFSIPGKKTTASRTGLACSGRPSSWVSIQVNYPVVCTRSGSTDKWLFPRSSIRPSRC